MTKEALKLALECLDGVWRGDYSGNAKEVITAIKEALANEALEKMAENARELGLDYEPPQRTWVGLTDEEIKRIGDLDLDSNYFGLWYDFARAIEAKLKEKNT